MKKMRKETNESVPSEERLFPLVGHSELLMRVMHSRSIWFKFRQSKYVLDNLYKYYDMILSIPTLNPMV